ncbi:MAG: hypothetical protein KGS72_09480 [Cyanobacteria bacterium REEB67]|nr:hypothetical protein [Cyanobacteria bacterium REEB67]
MAASAAMALCLSTFTSAARAQGSVNVKKGQLQQTGWYKSNMQVQIVDDGPIVHDYRTAPAKDPGYQIPIGPAGADNGRIPEGGIPLGGDGPRQMRLAPNTLPQSGFGGSNIPARGMGPATALPGTKMGGLGNQYAQQQKSSTGVSARPIGRPQTVSQSAGPASYGSGYGGPSGVSYGGAGSGGSSSANVSGKLLRSSLLGK